MLSKDEGQAIRDKADQFAEEFARLVRKYVPKHPSKLNTRDYHVESLLLAQMQDMTSCFSPYVWSKEFDPKDTP